MQVPANPSIAFVFAVGLLIHGGNMQVAEQRRTAKMAQGSLSQQKRGSLSQFGSRTASGHLAKKNESHLANS